MQSVAYKGPAIQVEIVRVYYLFIVPSAAGHHPGLPTGLRIRVYINKEHSTNTAPEEETEH